MDLKDITFFASNANNNIITNAFIKSIKKQVGDVNILIVDDSTYQPLELKEQYETVTVIDNTNHKITGDQGQVSRNHAAIIDFVIKNCIKTKWMILCDNDILFKPTIKNFLSKEYEATVIGEIIKDGVMRDKERIAPFFNLINVSKVNEFNVNYYDTANCETYNRSWFKSDGKYGGEHIISGGYETNDTGGSFLIELKNKSIEIEQINFSDYIVHLGGSYYKSDYDKSKWLFDNKDLWYD